MNNRRTPLVMAGIVLLAGITLLTPFPSASKPKLVVELYALEITNNSAGLQYDAYLILPDGTKAHGTCFIMAAMDAYNNCGLPEPVDTSKRSPDACKPCASNTEKHSCQHCIYQEKYPADRKGNDITLYASNRKIVFHIKNSW
jgi:hypothetical protein